MRISKKQLSFVIGAILLITTFTMGSFFTNNYDSMAINADKSVNTQITIIPEDSYTSTNPIVIDGDATGIGANNWTWAASQAWCSGSGTSGDPYIISDISIDADDSGNCIYIKDSLTANFTIQDCKFINSDKNAAGIKLERVKNGNIINNTITDNYYGILITGSSKSSNINMTKNIIADNNVGVRLASAENVMIWQNYFIYSGWAHLQNVTVGQNELSNGTCGNYWSEITRGYDPLYNVTVNYSEKQITLFISQDNYTLTGYAYTFDLNPLIANDTDDDGLDDVIELLYLGTLYNNNDTDADKMPDGWEINNRLDPKKDDADDDEDEDDLTNLYEYETKWVHDNDPPGKFHNTDPNDADSDNDGWEDGKEVDEDTDPTDPFDHPEFDVKETLQISYGFGYLIFMMIGIISTVLIIKRKQRTA